METFPALTKGDLVEIVWIDICEDSVGNPDRADLLRRTSFGLFWEFKTSQGVESLVTTNTLEDDHAQSGYCCYPTSCILDLKVIKKAKRNGNSARINQNRRPKRRLSSDVVEVVEQVHDRYGKDFGEVRRSGSGEHESTSIGSAGTRKIS